jgi:hypothetical protein
MLSLRKRLIPLLKPQVEPLIRSHSMVLNQFVDYLIKIGQTEAAEKLKNRTAEQWINCGAIFKDIEDTNPSNWMIEAFDWNKTEEGYDYWSVVCDAVEKDYYEDKKESA